VRLGRNGGGATTGAFVTVAVVSSLQCLVVMYLYLVFVL
jgi:hypothetical protein